MHRFNEFVASQTVPVVAATPMIEVVGLSYEDRSMVLPALAEALTESGCWLLDRRTLSLTCMEYHFEVSMQLIPNIYSALVGTGLELTRNSHRDLTSLCTLRKFNPSLRQNGTVASIRLQVQFHDDLMEPQMRSGGSA